MAATTPAGPASSVGPLPDFAGVYVAKPRQILIGPLVHLKHFLTAPTGSCFPNDAVVMPPPSLRYVVDCTSHPSDTPFMPGSATAASSTDSENRSSTVEALAEPTGLTLQPPSPQSETPATTTNTTAGTASSIPIEEVVERMHETAAAYIVQLRQRCVLSGMSTAGFATLKSSSPPQTASPLASSPSPPPKFVAVTSSAPSPMAEGTAQAPTAAATATTATAGGATAAGNRVHAVVASSKKRAMSDLHALAETTLGASHVLRCLISDAEDSLASTSVRETIQLIHSILQSTPDALIYIYSLNGKGTASALAALYLLEMDRVALSEVLLQRLPMCTPRMSCLLQLLERDSHPEAFDKLAYLRLYLAWRYPLSASILEAAVSTSMGNYATADRLVRLEWSLRRSRSDNLRSRESRYSSGALASDGAQPLSCMSSAKCNKDSDDDAYGSGCRGAGAGGAIGDISTSELSLCSSFVKDPGWLTERDESTIDSLYRALADSRVEASRDDVKRSYIEHRRSQELVLRQFLFHFRPSDFTTTPLRVAPYNCHSSSDSGCVTPTREIVKNLALPQFASPWASQRASTVPGCTVPHTMSAESYGSPEPTMQSVDSLLTPRETLVQICTHTPRSELRATLLAAPTAVPASTPTAKGAKVKRSSAVVRATTPRTGATTPKAKGRPSLTPTADTSPSKVRAKSIPTLNAGTPLPKAKVAPHSSPKGLKSSVLR
ncbi:hypothetical protein ABL78_6342 [Leptomonas seymouri]|uniref:Uncharacterized protein n=1 Tax=Leptomonas seymouri TaxID=5684 RepID=A0A0N1HTW1_LEPSE|nr:hypothetical protein ABL78_6342 [Leptomonas seymouri]|eukprot:KPI84610.1 hypothetical protein ABL78_6342 [Leptomonas seymouri]